MLCSLHVNPAGDSKRPGASYEHQAVTEHVMQALRCKPSPAVTFTPQHPSTSFTVRGPATHKHGKTGQDPSEAPARLLGATVCEEREQYL